MSSQNRKNQSKKDKKRKNISNNTSGESLQKVRLSDTQVGDISIPRLTTKIAMDPASSTPQQALAYSQGGYSPYMLPPPQSHFPSYVSPVMQQASGDITSMIHALSRKFDDVSLKLEKLDSIDRRLTQLEATMVSATGEIKGVKAQFTEIDKSLIMLNSICEENKSSVKNTEKTVNELSDQTTKLQNNQKQSNCVISELKNELQTLKEDHLDLQARSMRNNLVFDGLPEVNDENPEQVLTNFLSDEMGLTDSFELERVHRIGKRITGKHRPMVAKFSSFKQKEAVRKAAPRTLRGKTFWINEQFPREIADRRRKLLPHLKAARRQQKKAYLKVDKLYVNDRLFIPDTYDDQAAGVGTPPTRPDGNNHQSLPRPRRVPATALGQPRRPRCNVRER